MRDESTRDIKCEEEDRYLEYNREKREGLHGTEWFLVFPFLVTIIKQIYNPNTNTDVHRHKSGIMLI